MSCFALPPPSHCIAEVNRKTKKKNQAVFLRVIILSSLCIRIFCPVSGVTTSRTVFIFLCFCVKRMKISVIYPVHKDFVWFLVIYFFLQKRILVRMPFLPNTDLYHYLPASVPSRICRQFNSDVPWNFQCERMFIVHPGYLKNNRE